MNKLTINEQFLTLEQAKELQELGVNFSGANFCLHLSGDLFIGRSTNFFPYLNTFKDTLSVSEMMEMLPNEISCLEDDFLTHYYLIYDGCSMGYVEWCGGEISHYKINISGEADFTDGDKICIEKWNLRDALFEMLRWLEQNKLL